MSSMLISCKGPVEGELHLSVSTNNAVGSFIVGLNESHKEGYILFRLRVRESSMLFSKTYGLLGGSEKQNVISLHSSSDIVDKPNASTIRIEFVHVTNAEAATLLSQPALEREVCRPFFQAPGVLTYDVKLFFTVAEAGKKENPAKATAIAVGVFSVVAVLVGVAIGYSRIARQLS
ncbi:hypothetical protein AGDE_09375 [Angomonas deanei]|nr:hypothetical protein AGDE_09375 [Angomonas deanei]|eukprot:EPY30574.1 hypothetical protein AGDE_09375 [Angomonas deanei]